MTATLHTIPIGIFSYNRFNEFKTTINCLAQNVDSSNYPLYVFIDGPKTDYDAEQGQKIFDYADSIGHFKSVHISKRATNQGLARSIIGGVSDVFKKYNSIIVLEDDLVTSVNFLAYMRQALEAYQANRKIWSVSGFSFPIQYPQGYRYDAAFGVRASSWGWATWKDRWEKVDWSVADYDEFRKDSRARRAFNRGGSDLGKMLKDQMNGKINSWAIRFCYAQFRNDARDVFPRVSKVQNIGFIDTASNTRGMAKRFKTDLDTSLKLEFRLPKKIEVDPQILRQFRKPFSVMTRIKYKLINCLK